MGKWLALAVVAAGVFWMIRKAPSPSSEDPMAKGKKKNPKKPKRKRTLRREAVRKADKLLEAKEKLAALEEGGSADNPLSVHTASLVETRAEGFDCLRCAGATRAEKHDARDDVRVVMTRCKPCGYERTLYFKIEGPLLN